MDTVRCCTSKCIPIRAPRFACLARPLLTLATAFALTTNAQAHAFGARYDLPLPLWLYLSAAGAAVAVSFLIVAFLPAAATPQTPRRDATPREQQLTGAKRAPVWLLCVRTLVVTLLLVVVTAAFAGVDSATGNFATVFVWIVWWVGLIFFQALVADIWFALNPWQSLAQLAQLALSRAGIVHRTDFGLHYSPALSYWPALVSFFAFAWLELVSDLGEQPIVLGTLIVVYTVTTIVCACLFGIETWFSRADPFTVVFRIFGRFAAITLHDGLKVRLPGQGLLPRDPVPISMVILVMILLATVSFDGFVETPPWAALLEWVTISEVLRSPLLTLQGAGLDLLKLIKTLGLLSAVAIFVGVYVAVAWLVDKCSGAAQGLRNSAGSFVLSLVPIAIGYHIAHYLSYLLIAGQLIIPLASDPFALGWDLFGTRNTALTSPSWMRALSGTPPSLPLSAAMSSPCGSHTPWRCASTQTARARYAVNYRCWY